MIIDQITDQKNPGNCSILCNVCRPGKRLTKVKSYIFCVVISQSLYLQIFFVISHIFCKWLPEDSLECDSFITLLLLLFEKID